MGRSHLYLVTDLVGFYEKCGWEYVGEVNELDGGPIRLYGTNALLRHKQEKQAPLRHGAVEVLLSFTVLSREQQHRRTALHTKLGLSESPRV